MRKDEIVPRNYGNLLDRVAAIFTQARLRAIRDVNLTQVMAYYEIGKEIIEFEQKGKSRGEYGEKLIERLSKDMSKKFGRGFSPTNLKMMRLFYQSFPIRQTLSDESEIQIAAPANFTPSLSWSHYCELLKLDEPLARSFQVQAGLALGEGIAEEIWGHQKLRYRASSKEYRASAHHGHSI